MFICGGFECICVSLCLICGDFECIGGSFVFICGGFVFCCGDLCLFVEVLGVFVKSI